MAMKSHLKSATKAVTWRVFAGMDTFACTLAVTWMAGGDPATAVGAAFGVVGLEAATKLGWFYAHERAWESWFGKFFETEETANA